MNDCTGSGRSGAWPTQRAGTRRSSSRLPRKCHCGSPRARSGPRTPTARCPRSSAARSKAPRCCGSRAGHRGSAVDYARLFRLDGRVALVIGAGSGIGQSAARALAAHGADVVCADLNEAGARETAALIGQAGSRAESERVDIGREEDVVRLVAAVGSRHPSLDVVVTTPSINVRKPVLAYTAADLDRVLAINLKRTFYVLREAG